MSIESQAAIAAIAENEWTGIVVGDDGSIIAVLGRDSIASVEELTAISDQYSGCAFQFVPRGKLNQRQLEEIIQGIVEAIDYFRTHETRPGVNIPGSTVMGGSADSAEAQDD